MVAIVACVHHIGLWPSVFTSTAPAQGKRSRRSPGNLAGSAAVLEEPVAADLAAPIDIRKIPWETLHEAYQLEAQRCWGEGFDGKVPGYIAECLPAGHPLRSQEPPLRRRWLGPRKEDESTEAPDPYKTLGVSPDATDKEIKKAYLKKAKEMHPDRGGDAVDFQNVLLSYRILSDPDRKQEFDNSGLDVGDKAEEERQVKVPALDILQPAYTNHPELKWEPEIAELPGRVGVIQVDDLTARLTQVIFTYDGKTVAVWLPTEILIYVDDNGDEQPYKFFQQAIIRLNRGALIKPEEYMVRLERAVQFSIGWSAFDNLQRADPLRDAAFAQGYFRHGREELGGVVLDLGCGDGSSGRLFTKGRHFDLVFGLDNDSTALHDARLSGEEEELGPEQGLFLLRGDAMALPFRDSMIDYVWWSNGWDTVENPEEVLKGIFRILKIGGRLAIGTALGRPKAKEIERMLKELGFEETSIYPSRSKVFLNYASKLR